MYVKKSLCFLIFLLGIQNVAAEHLKTPLQLDYSLGLLIGIKNSLTEGNSAAHFIEDINPNSPKQLSCWQAGGFVGIGQIFEKPFKYALGAEYSLLYIQQHSWASHQIPNSTQATATNIDSAWQQILDFYWRLDNLFIILPAVQSQFSLGMVLTKHATIFSRIKVNFLEPFLATNEILISYRPQHLRIGFHLGARLAVQFLAFSIDYFFLPFIPDNSKAINDFKPLTEHSFSFSLALTFNQTSIRKLKRQSA